MTTASNPTSPPVRPTRRWLWLLGGALVVLFIAGVFSWMLLEGNGSRGDRVSFAWPGEGMAYSGRGRSDSTPRPWKCRPNFANAESP
jgi:hypothetical protein